MDGINSSVTRGRNLSKKLKNIFKKIVLKIYYKSFYSDWQKHPAKLHFLLLNSLKIAFRKSNEVKIYFY